MNDLISGVLLAGYLIAGLFFFRFWHRSRDRLFAFFAVAFRILALQRIGLALTAERMEDDTAFYILRLLAFILILVAIWDKNRSNGIEENA